MRALIRMSALAGAVFSTACVSLLPETAPPKPRYMLEGVEAGVVAGPAVSWSLVIDDPRTTRVYDSVRVAVSTAPGKIEYFAGAEWADRAPRLFQSALVESFENSGRILAVGDRTALPIGDIVLQTDIRRAHLDVKNKTHEAEISVFARLTDGKGTIYAAKSFASRVNSASDSADDVTASFDSAFDAVLTEIVNWTFEAAKAKPGLGA